MQLKLNQHAVEIDQCESVAHEVSLLLEGIVEKLESFFELVVEISVLSLVSLNVPKDLVVNHSH